MHHLLKTTEFKKISWNEIPDYGMYSEQVISYIQDVLISYFPGTLSLSRSMINNYVKHGMLNKPKKKKYYREQIALLIVITVLKQVLPLKSIREGVRLQEEIMGNEESYNEFMNILVGSIHDIFKSITGDEEIKYIGFQATRENIALTSAIHAFCFQTLTVQILNMKGVYDKEFL